MSDIKSRPFGKIDGKDILLYTIKNKNGMTAEITNYGAILVSLTAADRDGNFDDVVLGFDTLEEYIEKSPYFGATIGRVGNRIADGKFTLNGIEYQLAKNENDTHHLHGGMKGFDKVVWKTEPFTTDKSEGLKFSYLSPDGEENYPGNLNVEVIYELTDDNELKISFTAKTDKDTPVNLTHHSYFNLNGQGNSDIYDQEMMLDAKGYTPVNEKLIPTGEIAATANTPMDFTAPQVIGSRADQVSGGYDHNFILDKERGQYKLAAKTKSPKTGRVMETWTTEPAIQFYAGNFLDSLSGKGGKVYNKNHGFCLEPQHSPDSVNKPQFPSIILKPGEKYVHEMAYKFSIEN
ncbi:MAG: aldose epimerase family protein [Sedimentisphaeraceae bacterium JB056]